MILAHARADAARRLAEAGIQGAARDADRILAAVLGVDPGRLRVLDRDLTTGELARLDQGIAARAAQPRSASSTPAPLPAITSSGPVTG